MNLQYNYPLGAKVRASTNPFQSKEEDLKDSTIKCITFYWHLDEDKECGPYVNYLNEYLQKIYIPQQLNNNTYGTYTLDIEFEYQLNDKVYIVTDRDKFGDFNIYEARVHSITYFMRQDDLDTGKKDIHYSLKDKENYIHNVCTLYPELCTAFKTKKQAQQYLNRIKRRQSNENI